MAKPFYLPTPRQVEFYERGREDHVHMTEREKAIQGLRELADFLEAHTAIPITPHRINEFIDTREEWATIRDVAPLVLVLTDDFYVLRKQFSGGIVLEVNIERPREGEESIPTTTEA